MAKENSFSAAKLAQNWTFSWPAMDVLIGGKSAIDIPYLSVFSPAEAGEFIKNYGFDLSDDEDRRKTHALILEAWTFIESTLMPTEWKKGIRPPENVLSCTDPRQLVLWASARGEEDKLHRAWACAVLRVAHTAAHIDGVWAMIDAEAAARQIRERFEEFLHIDEKSGIWFGDERDHVVLEHIEWKAPKSRRSVFLKLLHKPGNVAENIYDLLGVRIVTKRLSDTMLVVKYLRDFHVVTFANCNPGRVRNSLIDFRAFQDVIENSKLQLLEGDMTPQDFVDLLAKIDIDLRKVSTRRKNPHSAQKYQSLQLTCRQLIKTKNPALGWMEHLEEYVKNLKKNQNSPEAKQIGNVLEFISEWPDFQENRLISSFFPYEVQIMDAKAYEAIKYGDASHEKYKMSQIRTARRRILNEVFTLVRHQLKDMKSSKMPVERAD